VGTSDVLDGATMDGWDFSRNRGGVHNERKIRHMTNSFYSNHALYEKDATLLEPSGHQEFAEFPAWRIKNASRHSATAVSKKLLWLPAL
jgi:hypothetical protein